MAIDILISGQTQEQATYLHRACRAALINEPSSLAPGWRGPPPRCAAAGTLCHRECHLEAGGSTLWRPTVTTTAIATA